jgi:SAM-dependent methyltransferase
MSPTSQDDEITAVAERYARRTSNSVYSILRPEVIQSTQEWQRKMLYLFGTACGFTVVDLPRMHLVDVGCGYGSHLLDFLRIGFSAPNICGFVILPERVSPARARVPPTLRIHEGDASSANIAPDSQDVVFQSVVFSSLLNDEFQAQLANRMWSWVRPGGGIMWYDFVYGNPRNPDVRAVPLRRVRELFPEARITTRRVTLAPPISRSVCRIHPAAYPLFNTIPLLRSHVLCWISKKA